MQYTAYIISIIMLAGMSTGIAGTWNTQQVFYTTGSGDTQLIGFSDNGASAGYFEQCLNFDSEVLSIVRTGTAGCAPARSPALSIRTGQETTGTSVIVRIGGCAITGGDNYILCFGDGSIASRGGIRAYANNQAQGPLSIDPTYRQLLAEDGITPVLTWSGSQAKVTNLKITGTLTLPTGAFPVSALSGYPGDGTLYLAGDGNWKSVATANIESVSGLACTLSASDNGKVINVNVACTITVPSSLPTGFNVEVAQTSSGQVSFVGSGGMVIHQRQSFSKIAGQYAAATLLVNATNSCILGGDLSN